MKPKEKMYGKIEFSRDRKNARLLLCGNNHHTIFTSPFKRRCDLKKTISQLVANDFQAGIVQVEGISQVLVKGIAIKRLLLITGPYRSTSQRFDAMQAMKSLVGLDWGRVKIRNENLL